MTVGGWAARLRHPRSIVTGRARALLYWFFTATMLWEMWVGGAWDLLRIQHVNDLVVVHLGYPSYFLTIMGMGKVAAGVVMAAPRLPRLKEWAYAGAFFTYAGAVTSHLLLGDFSPGYWVGPALFGLACLASWALRPGSRWKLTDSTT